MKIRVKIFENSRGYDPDSALDRVIHSYIVDYDDQQQRQVLGEQCKNALKAGQSVLTVPIE